MTIHSLTRQCFLFAKIDCKVRNVGLVLDLGRLVDHVVLVHVYTLGNQSCSYL